MELMNLLSDVAIPVYGGTFDVSLNWLGTLIKNLILGVGSVGLGIILFSVILKVIVLPFDVYQRIGMRKQNLKMKENQAKMEKLQKQYANDKQMYNQKVMEMYKESGFSMFSSCLPMILSMVIFIVAINAFNAFAQYSNIENYNTMVEAYNAKIEYYCADLDGENTSITVDGTKVVVKETGDNKYIYYTMSAPAANVPFATQEEKIAYVNSVDWKEKSYYIDKTLALENAEIQAFVNARGEGVTEDAALVSYFEDKAQDAVVEVYHKEDGVLEHMSFLWIKNIWATDASYKHPVLGYEDFKTEVSREEFQVGEEEMKLADMTSYTNAYSDVVYEKVTGKLDEQKGQANGYFVLIVLSVGTILLQQFVSMRSQKEQQKYSSVDGQGGSQQKMMMIIMTAMFAIFSFMYSSAFSIYMIMSNVLSLISTLVINKIVDIRSAKKETAALQAKYNQRFPRTAQDNKKNKKK